MAAVSYQSTKLWLDGIYWCISSYSTFEEWMHTAANFSCTSSCGDQSCLMFPEGRPHRVIFCSPKNPTFTACLFRLKRTQICQGDECPSTLVVSEKTIDEWCVFQLLSVWGIAIRSQHIYGLRIHFCRYTFNSEAFFVGSGYRENVSIEDMYFERLRNPSGHEMWTSKKARKWELMHWKSALKCFPF